MHNQKLNSYLGESNAFPYFSVYSHIFDTALNFDGFLLYDMHLLIDRYSVISG